MTRSIRTAAFPALLAASLFDTPVRAGAPPEFLTSFGSHGAGNGQFEFPSGVAVGLEGVVYVLDQGNRRVQAFDADGGYVFQWSTGWDGYGGIAVDPVSGSIFVIDTSTGYVRKYNRAGALAGSFATGGIGFGRSIAVNDAGQLAVTWRDTGVLDPGSRLARYAANGSLLSVVTRGDQFSAATFLPSGDLLVRDVRTTDGAQTIRRHTIGGTLVCEWGSTGSADGQFAGGGGVGVDAFGTVYVADAQNHRVQSFDACGAFVAAWGASGSGPGLFRAPADVAAAPSGRIYVADRDNHRIQVFAPAGTPTTPATWGRIKSRYR